MVSGFDFLKIIGQDAQQSQGGQNFARAFEGERNRKASLEQLLKGKEADLANQKAIKAHEDQLIADRQARNLESAQGIVDSQAGKGRKVSVGFSGNGGVNLSQSEMDSLGTQIGKAMRDAEITGHSITDPMRVIPSKQDAEQVKAGAQAVLQAKEYIPQTQSALSNSSWADRFGSMNIGPVRIGTEGGRDLEQRKAALLDFGRNLANTGVLQPGEIPMLERRIGDMTGLGAMFRKPEDINKQLSELEAQLRLRAETMAKARGYTPKAGYLGSSPQPKTLRVKHKASGQTGTLPANELTSDYEVIGQ